MTTLTEKKCRPCQGIGQALDKEAVAKFLAMTPGWQVDDEGKEISREFIMNDFILAAKIDRLPMELKK